MLWDLFVGMLLSFCGFGGLLIVVGLMCGLSDGVERGVQRGAIKEPSMFWGVPPWMWDAGMGRGNMIHPGMTNPMHGMNPAMMGMFGMNSMNQVRKVRKNAKI